eukprot:XP_028343838.1 uncharacterized protein LOC114485970 [Physeter catodon]
MAGPGRLHRARIRSRPGPGLGAHRRLEAGRAWGRRAGAGVARERSAVPRAPGPRCLSRLRVVGCGSTPSGKGSSGDRGPSASLSVPPRQTVWLLPSGCQPGPRVGRIPLRAAGPGFPATAAPRRPLGAFPAVPLRAPFGALSLTPDAGSVTAPGAPTRLASARSRLAPPAGRPGSSSSRTATTRSGWAPFGPRCRSSRARDMRTRFPPPAAQGALVPFLSLCASELSRPSAACERRLLTETPPLTSPLLHTLLFPRRLLTAFIRLWLRRCAERKRHLD